MIVHWFAKFGLIWSSFVQTENVGCKEDDKKVDLTTLKDQHPKEDADTFGSQNGGKPIAPICKVL